MLIASCHCGAVRIEMARKPVSLTQCTCSLCRRYAALWAYCTGKRVRVICDRRAVKSYSWSSRQLEFFHCRTSGCLTHYESMDKSPDGRIAVNARMLPPEDIHGIRIRTFDGADTWQYID